jgi:hypothetical protein
MSVKDLYPAIRPSLNLDFANTKTLDPRITFSRASTGTYYDGVTHAKAEENLLTYSQEFDTGWSASDVTVTADATNAPDGTATADTLDEGTSTAIHFVSISTPVKQDGTQYTLSVFAKYVDCQYLRVSASGAGAYWASTVFDIQNGTVADSGTGAALYTVHNTSITSVGSGWYRCSMVFSTTYGLSVTARIGLSNSGTVAYPADIFGLDSYTGTSRTAYVWGAQLEERSSVTAYTATTTQPITNYIPVLQSAAAGEARFDHDPVTGESKGLLIEEQRTNILTYSEDFSNAAWVKTNATVTNDVIGPDGTLSGFTLNEGTAAGYHNIQDINLFSADGNTRAWTLYVKKGSADYICISSYQLDYNSTGSRKIIFDFTTNSYSSIDGVTAIDPVHVGNGWYRIGFTDNLNNASYDSFRIEFTNSNTIGSGVFSYGGTGRDVYIWGAQVEAGAFPTSYIKTTSAQATRSADSASMTGTNFSEWYRQDEGSVIVEAQNYDNNGTDPKLFTISDGTGNNRIRIDIDNGNNFRIVVSYNGSAQTSESTSFTGYASFYKAVMAYAVNDFKGYIDGGYELTDTSGTIPLVDRLFIGADNNGAGGFINGHMKRLAYYPARLTNAQLQALTEG